MRFQLFIYRAGLFVNRVLADKQSALYKHMVGLSVVRLITNRNNTFRVLGSGFRVQ